jgi:UDP-glucose 4-epimerase
MNNSHRKIKKIYIYIQYLILCCILLFIFYFLQTKDKKILSIVKKEKVLVTGGLGFIGSNLVEELLNEGYIVVVFDDRSNGNNFNKNAITIIGDITNKEDFKKLPNNIDYVIHFAAAISVSESVLNPEKYTKINVEGSRNVLEWSIQHNIKKFISASSSSVYGNSEIIPLEENFELHPISPYAKSKLEMEKIQQEFYNKYNLTNICLRFFNVYGPNQNPKSPYSGVISKFIGNFFEKITIIKIFRTIPK